MPVIVSYANSYGIFIKVIDNKLHFILIFNSITLQYYSILSKNVIGAQNPIMRDSLSLSKYINVIIRSRRDKENVHSLFLQSKYFFDAISGLYFTE